MQSMSLAKIPKKLRKFVEHNHWLNYSRFSLHPNLFLVLKRTKHNYQVSVFDILTYKYYKTEAHNSYNEGIKSFNQKRDYFSRVNVLFDEPVEIV